MTRQPSIRRSSGAGWSGRRWIAAAAVAALLFGLPGLVPVAEAGHDDHWTFAAGIRLGSFHLSIGFEPVRYGHPTYYYRTRDAIHYDGYACTDRCYRRARTYYHHERCPVILHLMHREGIHPHHLYADHAPRYDGRWSSYDPWAWHRSYRGDDHYDRYDRHHDRHHDRYDRRYDRHDRRYERRGRYDRHDRYDDRHWRDRRHDDRRRAYPRRH